MVLNNSASNNGPCRIKNLSVTLLISSLTSVCSVKVSHATDSVDVALKASPLRKRLQPKTWPCFKTTHNILFLFSVSFEKSDHRSRNEENICIDSLYCILMHIRWSDHITLHFELIYGHFSY